MPEGVHQTLGFVIPKLNAYQLVRHPRRPMLLCTGGVSLASYGVLADALLPGVVPAL